MNRIAALAVIALGGTAFAQGSIFPSKQDRQLAKHLSPDEVSQANRKFLKGKMKAHGKDLKELSMAVATLDYARAAKYAQGIANQARLDPATAGADKLGYFALQDNLKKLATELVTIANEKDDQELVTAYAHLVQTCASCHHGFVAQKAAETPAEKAPEPKK
ncbi:MAG: hypothetical protein IT380_20150 [Myxococcales bacterium]|nr:hypothetical protein [Myxococcales bacterium]